MGFSDQLPNEPPPLAPSLAIVLAIRTDIQFGPVIDYVLGSMAGEGSFTMIVTSANNIIAVPSAKLAAMAGRSAEARRMAVFGAEGAWTAAKT
jgi:hypothetical protein